MAASRITAGCRKRRTRSRNWSGAMRPMISPKMARDQKLTDGDVISLTRGNFKMEAAVMIQPGHSDDTVSIALGYGRQNVRARGQGCRLQREPDPHQRRIVFRAGIRDRGDRQDARRWRPRRSAAPAINQEGRPLAREVARRRIQEESEIRRGDVGGSGNPLDLSASSLTTRATSGAWRST